MTFLIKIQFAIFVSVFSVFVFSNQTSQTLESKPLRILLEKAKRYQYIDPRRAINLLEYQTETFNKATDEIYFQAQFLRVQLQFKIGDYWAGQKTISHLEKHFKNNSAYSPWLDLLNAQATLLEQTTDSTDKLLIPRNDIQELAEMQAFEVYRLYLSGAAQAQRNNYELALNFLTTALNMAEISKHKSMEIMIKNQLIQLFFHNGSYKKAIDISDQMIANANALNDKLFELYGLANKMNIYFMQATKVNVSSHNDQAQSYQIQLFEKSNQLQLEVESKARKIRAYKPLIWSLVIKQNQLLMKNDYQSAIDLANESISLADRHQLEYEKAVSYNNLAIAHRELGQFKDSIDALNQAEDYFLKTSNEQSLLWIFEDYALAYQQNGQLEKAFEYYQKYHNAYIELLKKTNNKTVFKLQEEFAAKENAQTIQKLSQKAKIDEKRLEIEKMGRWLLSVVIAAILIFAYILFQQRLRLKELLKNESSMNQQLTELHQAKQRFFTNVSHEFRTSLTLSIEPLKDLVKNLNTNLTVKRAIKTALNNNLHMMSLVKDLFVIEQLDKNSLPIKATKINIEKALQTCAERYLIALDEKNITLCTKNVDPSLTIYFDLGSLDKVIANVLSNAIKFSPSNTSIDISSNGDSKYCYLKIQDHGPGVATHELTHIFERFYQGSHSLEQSLPGTGVGLAMVKEIIEQHSGFAKVENSTSGGCCTTLSFLRGSEHLTDFLQVDLETSEEPQCSNNNQPTDLAYERWIEHNHLKLTETKNTPVRPTGISVKQLILIVDDNPDMRHLIFNLLDKDYRCILAENGSSALKLAHSHQPDLIIADVMMPIMDGFQFSQKLKGDDSIAHIPLFLLTALAEKDMQLQGFYHGADDYITKPFDSDELLARIRNHLLQKQRWSEKLIESSSHRTAESIKPLAEYKNKPQHFDNLEELIEKNLNQWDFDVEKMYTSLNMTRATLFRQTKKLYGCSPKNLLKKRRLAAAYQMLKNNNGTVSEIAYAVGFQSLSTFSRAFREQYQYPPTKITKLNPEQVT